MLFYFLFNFTFGVWQFLSIESTLWNLSEFVWWIFCDKESLGAIEIELVDFFKAG